ncbi:MAG: diaminopimelate epimerase [Thiofilum sp.]|uniref:diaminopimelate epimerase n=1 Tax=Thiofilum sp. TaxID=2212733 RepID=UPI002600B497|nr:diaminopimelate epimerase [Thiofilum sp.]MBK8452897.1 diaminopimelate epimerase [Thiofilum sp.]
MTRPVLQFVKMHGLGNDFMVIDGVRQQVQLSNEQVKHLGDRHFGVGFDQLLLVESYEGDDAEFRYRIFNADGSEVEQCGNGARCFARFVYDQGLTQNTTIPVMTAKGRIVLVLQPDGMVTVDMGKPILTPAEIPFIFDSYQSVYNLSFNEHTVAISAISMGNPHAVLVVDNVDTAPVQQWGEVIERHAQFPRRVNVGFMQVLNPEQIRLRVFERAVGETLACGTGACAAVVAGQLRGLLAERVGVELPGGRLQIEWLGEGHSVKMTGPATTVFSGVITL